MFIGTDADIASARRQDRGVDADHSSLQVDQRAARIARVDGRVGLDEILIAFDAGAAPERADDPGGNRLTQSKGIADGEYKIADLQALGIADRDRGQAASGDLQHCNVGIGIAADQFRLEAAVVLGRNLDAARILDDMGIRQHIALTRIDDHAGPSRLRLTLDRLLHVEETAEHRVLQQRIIFADPPTHRNADDALGDPADNRRKTLDRSAAKLGDRCAGQGNTEIARHHHGDPA
jgi:hypothetical protein